MAGALPPHKAGEGPAAGQGPCLLCRESLRGRKPGGHAPVRSGPQTQSHKPFALATVLPPPPSTQPVVQAVFFPKLGQTNLPEGTWGVGVGRHE